MVDVMTKIAKMETMRNAIFIVYSSLIGDHQCSNPNEPMYFPQKQM